MKTILLLLLSLSCAYAEEFKTPDQITKEFKEPGHIPQGLHKSPYHKLDEVISKDKQEEIKAKRRRKKHKAIKPSASFGFSLFQSAHASAKPIPPSPSPVPSPVVPGLKQAVDLRNYDSAIRNQWDGTCTAHGLIAGMENLYNRNASTRLSTRYFWSKYRQYSAEVAMRTAAKVKQIDEIYWPQAKATPTSSDLDTKGKYSLLQQEYLGDDTSQVVKALDKGYPVYVAMSVPSDMASCRSSIRYTTGVTNGGHALAVVGYRLDSTLPGGGYMILKNSWGTDCGDRGYQYMPLGLCQKNSMYCVFWALKSVGTL